MKGSFWKVTLVLRHKLTGKAYAGEWFTAATCAVDAVTKVLADLDVSGMDLVQQEAEAWDARVVAALGPMRRALGHDEPTAALGGIDGVDDGRQEG